MTTYNAQTDWKKIDWTKLKQTIHATEEGRVGPKGTVTEYCPDWKKRREQNFGDLTFQMKGGGKYTWTAGHRTILYAIVSHLHGKLHMTEKEIPLGDASGGTEKVPFTMEMQAKLIGDEWKQFLLPETAAVVPEEPKTANG